jgi:branched-chain amino acid transport system substrate-binding protein
MWTDGLRRRLGLVCLTVIVALAMSGCGGGGAVLKIGALVDCTGLLGSFHDSLLASTELPLLEKGGRLVSGPHGLVAAATIGGTKVQLFEGCTETGVFDTLIASTRRLVENDHVGVLVGPFGVTDGIVFKGYLREHPEVTAVFTDSTAQAVTLHDPIRNLFRFTPDGAQQAAGLGSYAYTTLGWRTANVIDDGFPYSWEGAAGFDAEFCSLGGKIVSRAVAPTSNPAAALSHLNSPADGTVVLLSGGSDPTALLHTLTRRGKTASTVLMWRATVADPTLLSSLAPELAGVVIASDVPAASPALRRVERTYVDAFPGQPGAVLAGLGLYDYVATAAVVAALEAVHGDLGPGQRRFRSALAELRLEAPEGPVHLDRNRQAVTNAYLLRIEPGRGGSNLRTIRVLRGVDESYGGYLSRAPEPTATTPGCKPRPVPAWAR